MVTFIIHGDNEVEMENFWKYLEPLKEVDKIEKILLCEDVAGGQAVAPTKKRKYIKWLPPAIAPDATNLSELMKMQQITILIKWKK